MSRSSVFAQLVAIAISCSLRGPSSDPVFGCNGGVRRQSADKIKRKQRGSSESLPVEGCRLGTKEKRS
jgi:hypothetical protein